MKRGLHQLLTGAEVRAEDADRWTTVAAAWAVGQELLEDLESEERAARLPMSMTVAPCPLCGLTVIHPDPCARCGDVGALPLGDYLAAWEGRALAKPEVAPFDDLLDDLEDDHAVRG